MTFSKISKSTLVLVAFMIVTAMISMAGEVKEAPTRDQIEDKYKWDLTDFYPSDQTWEESLNQLKSQITQMEEFKGKLGSSGDVLARCLMLSDSLGIKAHRLYVYANLKLDEDQRVSKYQQMSRQSRSLMSDIGQAGAFIEPEILKIPDETLKSFLGSSKDLALYRFYLEDLLRRKAHVMSEEVENVLALAGSVTAGPNNVFDMIDNADIKFPVVTDENGDKVELTRQRLSKLLESTNRAIRKEASDAYNDTYLKYSNALGANLASSVEGDMFYTKVRGYKTDLDRSLDANNIPTSVFFNLIDAVNKNLAPLHKYVSLRKKLLGLDTLFVYDMSVPLVPEAKMEFTYDEAKELTLKALQPLGEEYLKNIRNAFDSRWIDVYETQGKYSGAYSWNTYSVHPVALFNFAGTLENVFTLAHEMGHAMHSYYSNISEPYVYAGHSLFTAEVASTCNEALMMKYMIDNAKDKDQKLYLLNYYIEQIFGTFYSQVWFSEFEQKIHDVVESGGALSSESMRKLYREIYVKYYGPDYFIPENRDLGALRIDHFYRMYYVYQYATGYAAAQMLSKMILDKQPGATDAYLKFIRTGSSDYPINVLKKAGIDMTTPVPVENTIKIFSDLVDQFEQLILAK